MRLLLITILLTSCGSLEKYHPIILDTDRGYGRIYNIKKVKPNQCGGRDYLLKYSDTNISLPEMNGYVCFKKSEVSEAKREYDEYLKKEADCR